MPFNVKKQLLIGSGVFVSGAVIGIPVIVATTFNSSSSSSESAETIKNDKIINNINPSFIGTSSTVQNTNLSIENFTINNSSNPRINYKITSVDPLATSNSVEITFEGNFIDSPNFQPVVFKENVGGFLYSAEQLKNTILEKKLLPTLKSTAINKKPSEILQTDLIEPDVSLLPNSNLFSTLAVSFSFTLSPSSTSDNIFGNNFGREITVNTFVTGRNGISSQGSYSVKLKNDVASFINSEVFQNNLSGTVNGESNNIAKAILESTINKNSTKASSISANDFKFSSSEYTLNVPTSDGGKEILIKQEIGSIDSSNNIIGNVFVNIKITADLSSLEINGIAGPKEYSFEFQQEETDFIKNSSLLEKSNEALLNKNIESIISASDISLLDPNQLVASSWNKNSFKISDLKKIYTQMFNLENAQSETINYELELGAITPSSTSNSSTLEIIAVPKISTNIDGVAPSNISLGTLNFEGSISSIEEAKNTEAINSLANEALVPTFQNPTNNINLNSLASEVVPSLTSENFSTHFNFQIPAGAPSGTTYTILKIDSIDDSFGSVEMEIKISISGTTIEKNYSVKFFGFLTTSEGISKKIEEIVNDENNTSLKTPIFQGLATQNTVSVDEVSNSQLNLQSAFLNKLTTAVPSARVEIQINPNGNNSQTGEIRGVVLISANGLNSPVSYPFVLGGFLSSNEINNSILQDAFKNIPTISITDSARTNVVLPGLLTTNDFNIIAFSNSDIKVKYLSVSSPNILLGVANLEVELSISNGDGSNSTLINTVQVRNLPTLQTYMSYLSQIVKPILSVNQHDKLVLPSQIIPTNPVFPGTTDPVFSLQKTSIRFIENIFTDVKFRIKSYTPNDTNGSANIEIELFVTNAEVPSIPLGQEISSQYSVILPSGSFDSNRVVINDALTRLTNIINNGTNDPNNYITFNGSKNSTNASLVNESNLIVAPPGDFTNENNVAFSVKIISLDSENGSLVVNLVGSISGEEVVSSVPITITGFQTDSESVETAFLILKNSISTTPQIVFNGKTSTGGIKEQINTSVSEINSDSFSFDFNNDQNLFPSGTINPENLVKYSIVSIPNTFGGEGKVTIRIKLEKGSSSKIDDVTISGFKKQ